MSKDDEEFTAEEMRAGRLVIRVIYELAIVLMIAITVLTAYAGYWGWPWYLVIPIAAPLIFGARVMRRYFRDIWVNAGRELGDTRGTIQAPPRSPRPSGAPPKPRPTGVHAAVIVVVTLLAIAAFWYGIGVAVRMLLPLF